MTIGVERSGLVAMRAIRAEAQGICSRSPFELLRPVPYGKSNPQRRGESSVFRRQWAVNCKGTVPSDRTRFRSALNVSQIAAKRGRFSFERLHSLMSARTAIRHDGMRVFKIVVDGARLYRWADAAPLAGSMFLFIIRCPEIWSRDRAARGR